MAQIMNKKIYAYIKKGENVKRIEKLLQKASHKREAYYDLYTDSDRSYIAYNQLKKDILKEKGILIISSINNIGANKQDVYNELLWLRDNKIEIVFADYPTTHIFDNPSTNNLALSVICDVYASLLANKTFDIRPSLAATTGRKKIDFPKNWESLYAAWNNGKITTKEFISQTGLKKGTFYNLINEYKDILKINKNTMNIG
ncbi:hypothetical protein [Ligilactobacillus sp. Marseille-Q7487]|jgi:hypothetical protein|uniref:hypothetical protein n=1 Tax=Ligilactobacillus sp. Marseille-Q7487 TaxID=3022128 RepID=UPI0024A9E140|nr:hypothetical protein [Ligilactobacillus sp. Marseille-Q7487]